MSTLVVVQARMASTRLPGKVMRPVAGAPMLQRMIERIRSARSPFDLVVATTLDAGDDCIERLCHRIDVGCFRGHPTDLLDRHVAAGRGHGAELVVKVPSDCPLIDPAVLDRVLAYTWAHPGAFDFVSNLHPATYPDGNDVEVVPLSVLEIAHREARRAFEREHTTPYLWDRPERFRLGNVTAEDGSDRSLSHRLTVDYPEDHALVAAVYDALWTAARPGFGVGEIVRFLADHPEVFALNARHAGVSWYRNHLDELRTVSPVETRVAPRSA